MAGEEGFDLPCGAGRLGLQHAPGTPFTTAPVQSPFLNSKRQNHRMVDLPFWQGKKASNPRPTVLETAALPAELFPCIQLQFLKVVDRQGLEPRTDRL